MPKPFTEWTVLPHGKLSRLDDNMLTVTGELHMPLGDFPRRMTVVRLSDARLVIYSAISLHESEMRELESFGVPAYLVVPGELHRLDAKVWKERYPLMKVLAPQGVRSKVEEIVPVDSTYVDFADPRVHFITVPGTAEHEVALEVKTDTGTTLVINDLIWNVNDRPGLSGWLFRVLGLTGKEPKIPRIVELRSIKAKGELQKQLEAWSRIPDLNRIVLSHGSIVTREPSATLVRLAEKLAA
jgi:hypothetical protein